MIEWHIEKRKISDLKDYAKNPRRLTKEQAEHLQASLEKFGLAERPIVNLDNTIIGGHQRRSILKKMGLKEIECNVPSRMLDDKEVEEFCIRLNKNSGEFNWDLLANNFEVLDLVEYGFQIGELIGNAEQIPLEEPKKEKGKKLKMCPQCGHEF